MSITGQDINNIAVFCDFENLALGAQDAKYASFDIKRILERLLLKGNVVVRKAYCDWDRYKSSKRGMHEASFELIEIPHVRQSGKNSADIRMVVDALDLCYTKAHLNTFAIISGDSDFSPLVAKLRENDKVVIGVGVKNSTSDLFISICDEFIFYDDLVRENERKTRVRKKPAAEVKKKPAGKKDGKGGRDSADSADDESTRKEEAIDLVKGTVDELVEERGAEDKLWGSMVKQTLKRRQPGFNERYYGFRSFNDLLEEAQKRGLLKLEWDEKSGGCTVRAVASRQ